MSRRSASIALLLVASTAISGVASARRCPNIMLVIDKSGSMLQDPSGGGNPPSKWTLVVGAVNQTMGSYADRIPFGLTTFASFGAGPACASDTTLEVEIAYPTPLGNNGARIRDALNKPPDPNGNTNTGDGILRALKDSKYLADQNRDNYLVLITDGTPNCRSPEPQTTIDAIKQAAMRSPSVHTFVIGFDAVQGQAGVDPVALNDMAIAGLEAIVYPGGVACDRDPAKQRPCYYSASDAAKFKKAIETIIGGLAGATVIGACDDSCFSLGCPAGKVCTITSAGSSPECIPDVCASMNCDAGTYCKEGHCLKPCPTCLSDVEVCRQESCIPNKCPKGHRDQCAMVNDVCNSDTGQCAPDLCASGTHSCPLPSFCDPLTGSCVDDPCRLINCPALSTCYNGYCMSDPPEDTIEMGMSNDGAANQDVPDMALEGNGGNPVPRPGCGGDSSGSCTVNGRPDVGGLLLLSLAGALHVARRRRGRGRTQR